MGVLTGILGTLSTLSSLSLYAEGCMNNLPSVDEAGNSYTWEYGPGFACLLLATLLKPADVVLHALTPVVKVYRTSMTLYASYLPSFFSF